jgi:hypothetical protein
MTKLTAILSILLVGLPMALAKGTSLDGRTYKVVLGPEGKRGDEDTLTFAMGKFESSMCVPLGFKAAKYEAKGSDEIAFTVVVTNKQGQTNKWKGTIHGDQIEGTLTCTGSGDPMKMVFKGQLAK